MHCFIVLIVANDSTLFFTEKKIIVIININKMLFLTSELANKAEITILSARDTTRAWVPGRGIMGRDVEVYKTGYGWFAVSRNQK